MTGLSSQGPSGSASSNSSGPSSLIQSGSTSSSSTRSICTPPSTSGKLHLANLVDAAMQPFLSSFQRELSSFRNLFSDALYRTSEQYSRAYQKEKDRTAKLEEGARRMKRERDVAIAQAVALAKRKEVEERIVRWRSSGQYQQQEDGQPSHQFTLPGDMTPEDIDPALARALLHQVDPQGLWTLERDQRHRSNPLAHSHPKTAWRNDSSFPFSPFASQDYTLDPVLLRALHSSSFSPINTSNIRTKKRSRSASLTPSSPPLDIRQAKRSRTQPSSTPPPSRLSPPSAPTRPTYAAALRRNSNVPTRRPATVTRTLVLSQSQYDEVFQPQASSSRTSSHSCSSPTLADDIGDGELSYPSSPTPAQRRASLLCETESDCSSVDIPLCQLPRVPTPYPGRSPSPQQIPTTGAELVLENERVTLLYAKMNLVVKAEQQQRAGLVCRGCLYDNHLTSSSANEIDLTGSASIPKIFDATSEDLESMRDHVVAQHPFHCAEVASLSKEGLEEVKKRA